MLHIASTVSDAEYQAMVWFAFIAIIAIIVFFAIMRLYSINNTLLAHTALLKEQQQELATLIQIQQEELKMLNIIANNTNATKDPGDSTCDTDNSQYEL